MDQRSLVVCAVFRNAAHALPEWIAYHYAIGFDRFVLYDNASSDGGADLLRRFALADRVTVIQWPQQQGQLSAYRHFIDIFAPAYDWAAFIDVDEFILPLGGCSLQDTLQRCAQASAILVNARVFGPAGHDEPAAGLVIESFDRRVDDALPVSRHVKSIVRCAELLDVTQDVRTFRLKGGACNPAGQAVPNVGVQQAACFEGLTINHYYTKSRREWLAKVEREGNAAGGPGYAADLFDQLAAACQVKDEAIKTYAPQVRALLGLDAASGANVAPSAPPPAPAPAPASAPPSAPSLSPSALSSSSAPAAGPAGIAAPGPAAAPSSGPTAPPEPGPPAAAASSPTAAPEPGPATAPVSAPISAPASGTDAGPMVLTPGVLPETVPSAARAAAPTLGEVRSGVGWPGADRPVAAQAAMPTAAPTSPSRPVPAEPQAATSGWTALGADALEHPGGLALVFRDRSRPAAPWLAALRGAAATQIDPDFLLDEAGHLRDFPDAWEAQAACEAELAHDHDA